VGIGQFSNIEILRRLGVASLGFKQLNVGENSRVFRQLQP